MLEERDEVAAAGAGGNSSNRRDGRSVSGDGGDGRVPYNSRLCSGAVCSIMAMMSTLEVGHEAGEELDDDFRLSLWHGGGALAVEPLVAQVESLHGLDVLADRGEGRVGPVEVHVHVMDRSLGSR